MKKTLTRYLIFSLVLILVSSCRSHQDFVYFQQDSTGTNKIKQFESIIAPNDLLSIIVSSLDPISSAPFNLPIVSYASPNSDQLYSQPVLQAYLVDNKGNIDFPVLGNIKLGGLSKTDAVNLLQKELQPYLKDPIVNIRITNYGVSVLGEVNRPGTFLVANEKVSVLEAIALAGDLTAYGKRENILLIRENENQEKIIINLDLRSKDILNSPYFYLRQNDVIYVEPNKTKANTAKYSPNSSILISAVSTAVSVIAVIFSIIR